MEIKATQRNRETEYTEKYLTNFRYGDKSNTEEQRNRVHGEILDKL